jgi:asparagine synthase (glutamine-hydrolysing)
VDVDSGHQPMAASDGLSMISFNGEIYNYRELREDLKREGITFLTHSDTEVILKLYLHCGVQGFSRLRGMYAFAIWDHNQQCGILARDPIGIKPLFYYKNSCDLVFASEAKAIQAWKGGRAELDTGSLHLLMNFRYVPGQRSLFRDVVQLKQGTVLCWRPGGSVELSQITPQVSDNIGVMDAFSDSIKSHLEADVEIASYLSGGVDSGAIAALIAKNQLLDYPMKTYTLAIGDDPNEALFARETADALGFPNFSEHKELDVSTMLPKIIWHLEKPKVNALQVNRIAHLAAKDVKVALSGVGGDELFLGYNLHRIIYQLQRTQKYIPQQLLTAIGGSFASLSQFSSRMIWQEIERGFLCLKHSNDWSKVYGLIRNVWDVPGMREKIYGPRMLDSSLPSAFDYLSDNWPDNRDPLIAVKEYEWKEKLANDLLWQEDRCSMAEGLEVRVPFLDAQLKHSVDQLTTRQLMPNGQAKHYFKQHAALFLPEGVTSRRKSGFQVQIGEFMANELSELSRRYLNPDAVKNFGLFNPVFVRDVLALKQNKRYRWHNFMLYLMLGSHIWVDLFENQISPSDLAEAH